MTFLWAWMGCVHPRAPVEPATTEARRPPESEPVPGWEQAAPQVMTVASPALRSCAAVEFEAGALRSWRVGIVVDAGGVVTDVTVVGEPDSRFAQCARTSLVGRVVGGSSTVWDVPLPLVSE